MLNFIINNEAIQGGIPISLLTNNPYIEDMSTMADSSITKICTKCNIEKSVDEFCKKANCRDEFCCWCKACNKLYYQIHKKEILAQKKQYYEDHREDIKAQSIQYYEDNKDKKKLYAKQYHKNNKEKINAYLKRYYEDNKEKSCIWSKQYYRDNKKEIKAYVKQYRKDNKEHISVWMKQYGQTPKGKAADKKSKQKRRAQKMGVNYEDFNSSEVFERDGYRCQLCGKKTRPDYKNPYHPLYPNLDHIIPLSKGGEHSKQNTQCLCRRCNMKKNNNGIGNQLRMFG